MSARPVFARYVLGDWCTTHLRLYLMERDQVIDVRDGVSIGNLTGPPAEVLTSTIDRWLGTEQPIDVVLCGMASSRNGLHELPYVKAPASFASRIGRINVLLRRSQPSEAPLPGSVTGSASSR